MNARAVIMHPMTKSGLRMSAAMSDISVKSNIISNQGIEWMRMRRAWEGSVLRDVFGSALADPSKDENQQSNY